MVKVCVIENNIKQLIKLKSYICNTIEKNNLDMAVEISTTDVKDFMFNIEWDDSVRIYFIDIDLGGYISGIDLAVFIRKYDKYGYIVFINSFGDFNQLMVEYKIKVVAVIEKENDVELASGVRNSLLEVDRKLLFIEKEKDKILRLCYGDRELELIKDEIMFFEAIDCQEKVIIHSKNKQIVFNGSIIDIKDKLGDEFKLLDKSILINQKNINEIKDNKRIFTFVNGEEIHLKVEKVGLFDKIKKIMKH